MSCPLEEEVMCLDSGAVSSERRELEEHARSCARCGEVLETLRAARTLARTYAPQPSAAARARMLRNVEAAAHRRPKLDLRWILVPAAAALAALIVVATKPAPEPVHRIVEGALTRIDGSWVRADRVSRADLGIASVAIERGAILNVVAHAAREVDVRLYRGEVSAAVEKLGDGDSFEINTRQARIKVVGTRFTVRAAEEETSVSVEEGTVWVWPLGATEPLVLNAGQQHHIGDKKPEPVVISPPPPPPPVPENKVKAAPPKVEAKEARVRLSEARAALDANAPRAARVAQEILAAAPDDRVELEALLLLADAERQNGKASIAADHYRRVAEHPRGKGYAEEALLHRARLLERIGDSRGALEALRRAESSAPNGALAPERCRLEAELYTKAGDLAAAIEALDRGIERARNNGDASTAEMLLEQKSNLKGAETNGDPSPDPDELEEM